MTEQQPSAAEMEKMQAVAQAGAEAGAQADTPEQASANAQAAMRTKADQVKLELSDDQIKMLADTFVKGTVAEFQRLGAFDPPPEPVQPPDQPPAPTPPADQHAAAAAAPAPGEAAPTPQRRSLAAKFLGG